MRNAPTPEGAAPTMIIPNGTKIEVDHHGQLSIRTPGNLVLQNSGSYGTIESATGSIRIEPNVQIEAVNIQCADVCYIQGSLTAWKVQAKAIELEESARAHIILQETESLQIGREARLVGNFSSERELFLLLSRFTKQLRQVPFYGDKKVASVPEEFLRQAGATPPLGPADPDATLAVESGQINTPPSGSTRVVDPSGSGPIIQSQPVTQEAVPKDNGELPDSLFFALVLLERESSRPNNGPTAQRAIEELVRWLRGRQLAELDAGHLEAFNSIVEPSDDVMRARELVVGHFATV